MIAATAPQESNADYHADLSHISASMLKKLRESPRLFEQEYLKKTTAAEPKQFKMGTAIHCALLEPDKFREAYALPDASVPTDGRKKAARDWRAEHEAAGRIALTHAEHDTLNGAYEAVRSHPYASTLLDASGPVEHTVRWEDERTGAPCKLRCDKVLPLARICVDIKTIDAWSEKDFAYDCGKYGYHIQRAHYLSGLASEYGNQRDDWRFVFVVVEKSRPFRCRVRKLDVEAAFAGETQRDALLGELWLRMQHGDWSEENEETLAVTELPRKYL